MVLAIEIIILAVSLAIGLYLFSTRGTYQDSASMRRSESIEIARNTGGDAHNRRLARRHLERAAKLGNA
jgi:hypothetical protein